MADNLSTSSSEEFKRFIVKLLLFAALLVVLDRGVGTLLESLQKRARRGDFGGVVNRTLEQRRDVVIFGSSRAQSHCVPEVIGEFSGTTVHNAGVAAQTLLTHYCIEQLLLDHYAPKAILLDLNVEDLRKKKTSDRFEKLSMLLPFYGTNESVDDMLRTRSKWERVKLASAMYPYNSKLFSMLKNLVEDTVKKFEALPDGYVPLYGGGAKRLLRTSPPIDKTDYTPPSDPFELVDAFSVDVLTRFIETARRKDIEVIIFISPLWLSDGWDLPSQPDVLTFYKRFLDQHDVPLIEITQDTHPVFKDEKLFRDRIHLRHEGAVMFSELLGKELGLLLDTSP